MRRIPLFFIISFILLSLVFGCSRSENNPIDPVKPDQPAWTPDRATLISGQSSDPSESYWNTSILFSDERWIAHLNQNGTLSYASGKGVQESSNPLEVISNHPEMFYFPSDNFRIDYDEVHGKIRYVIARQLYEGLWVFPSKIDLRYAGNGKLVMASAYMFPDINVNTTPSISLETARNIVESELDDTEIYENGQLLVWVSEETLAGNLAWMIDCGNWRIFVDAHNGTILEREHHYWEAFTGHIHGNASQPDPIQPEVPYTFNTLEMRMSYDPDDSYPYYAMPITNWTGDYTYTDPTYTQLYSEARFYSPYVNVNNGDDFPNNEGAINKTTYNNQPADWEFSNSNSIRSERTGFVWVTGTAEFLLSLEPSYNLLHKNTLGFAMSCNVNNGPWCNAYADESSINFFNASDGCVDTGHVPDIVVHEYEHFNTFQQYGYDQPDSAMHEGMSDALANLMIENHYIGYNVQGSGTYFRDSKNDYTWPADWCDGEGHCLGMLLAGAYWDMYEYLGKDYVGYLLHYSRYGRPQTFQEMGLEVMIVDDEDGDWTNGTPNYPIIFECFETNHAIDIPDVTIPEGLQVTATPTIPDTHVPRAGGNFTYALNVHNLDSTPIGFNIWAEVKLPGGYVYGPIIPPGYLYHAPYWLTFVGDQNFDINLTQIVPGGLAAGTYEYHVKVGNYGVEIYDDTFFNITIDP
jgi:hypothetical protein